MGYVRPHPRNGNNASAPQIMSGFVDSDYIYGVHIDEVGHGHAFRCHYPTGVIESIPIVSIAGNHMEMPLYDPDDDHYSLPVGVCPNATGTKDEMFIIGNHHDNLSSPTTTHMIQCNNVDDFENPASWAASSTAAWDGLDAEAGANAGTYTYHIFDRLEDGTLLHFLSQSELASSSQGRDWLAFKRVDGVWSSLLASGGHFATTENTGPTDADRVYVMGVLINEFNGVETIHVSLIFRLNDSDATSQQSPCYIKSVDGGLTWTAVDGTPQPMPITWANKTPSLITSAPAYSASYRFGIYTNPSTGYPAIIVRDQSTNNYRRLSYDGADWISELAPAVGGEIREFEIKGTRWYRTNSQGRLSLRRANGLQSVYLGGRILTAGTNYSPSPDPIRLRDGVFVVNVGNGSTPKLYSLGNGPRMN